MVTASPLAWWTATRPRSVSDAEQRHVAVGDDDGALEAGRERLERALDGATGALDLVLVGDEHVGVVLEHVLGDLVALVPHDDGEVLGSDPAGSPQGMPHERAPADRVQHLGDRGLHACALASSKDDHGGRPWIAHGSQLLCIGMHVGCGAGPSLRLRHAQPCYSRVDRAPAPVLPQPCGSGGLSGRAPRVGVEPTSLVLIQSQAGPADRPTGERHPGRRRDPLAGPPQGSAVRSARPRPAPGDATPGAPGDAPGGAPARERSPRAAQWAV